MKQHADRQHKTLEAKIKSISDKEEATIKQLEAHKKLEQKKTEHKKGSKESQLRKA